MKRLFTLALTLAMILASVGGAYAQDQTENRLEEGVLADVDLTVPEETLEAEQQAILEEEQDNQADEDVLTEQAPLADTDQTAAYAALSAQEREIVDTYFNGIVPAVVVTVSTYTELWAVLLVSSIDEVVLANDIVLEDALRINRDITFTGGSEAVPFLLAGRGIRHIIIDNADIEITFNRVQLAGECIPADQENFYGGVVISNSSVVLNNMSIAFLQGSAVQVLDGSNVTINNSSIGNHTS